MFQGSYFLRVKINHAKSLWKFNSETTRFCFSTLAEATCKEVKAFTKTVEEH